VIGVTGLKFTQFLHNVARSLPLNRLKLELHYSILFWNVTVTNEGESAEFPNFGPKIGAMATSLEQLEKKLDRY